MSSYAGIRVQFDTLRSLAYTGISGSYAQVGAAFAYPARIVKISNNTNADILVSFDGTTNHDYVAAGGFVLYDYSTNKNNTDIGGYFFQAIGTQVYVLSSGSPSSGSVYVTVIYAA
jgi:hypothetical protein